MAQGIIFNVATTIPGNPDPLQLQFTYNYDDHATQKITFVLLVGNKATKTEIRADSDLVNQTVSFRLTVTALPVSCLTVCAGSALIKVLVECFNSDPQKYIDCLVSKGLSTTSDIAGCALACFAGAGMP